MCAIMNKLRRISAAARHRPVFDLRIPLFRSGEFLKIPTFREMGVVGSRLTQPLFTRFTNLLQNKASASKQIVRQSQGPARQHAERHAIPVFSNGNVTKFLQHVLYFCHPQLLILLLSA
jgi:hypothetical protein